MFNHTANAKGWWPLPAWLRALGSALAGVFLHQPSSPWLPVLLYGPLAPACVLWGVLGGAPPWALLVLPPAGFLVWTLMEYILHSGAFHNPARSTILRGIEASHLGHHDDPKDPNLMVARLAISLPLAVLMCALFLAVLRNVMLAGLMLSGLIVGYLAYEVVHFAIHRSRRWRRLLHPLVRYHLYHHHKDPTRCYGVTTPLWDWVFGTGRPRKSPADV